MVTVTAAKVVYPAIGSSPVAVAKRSSTHRKTTYLCRWLRHVFNGAKGSNYDSKKMRIDVDVGLVGLYRTIISFRSFFARQCVVCTAAVGE